MKKRAKSLSVQRLTQGQSTRPTGDTTPGCAAVGCESMDRGAAALEVQTNPSNRGRNRDSSGTKVVTIITGRPTNAISPSAGITVLWIDT